jgi:hypothetical protein
MIRLPTASCTPSTERSVYLPSRPKVMNTLDSTVTRDLFSPSSRSRTLGSWKATARYRSSFFCMVGAPRFELGTPCTPCVRTLKRPETARNAQKSDFSLHRTRTWIHRPGSERLRRFHAISLKLTAQLYPKCPHSGRRGSPRLQRPATARRTGLPSFRYREMADRGIKLTDPAAVLQRNARACRSCGSATPDPSRGRT